MLTTLWSLEKTVDVRVELALTLNSGGQPKIKIKFNPEAAGGKSPIRPPLAPMNSLQQSKTARM